MSLVPTWPIAAATLVVGLIVGAGADHLWMNGKVDKAEKRYDALVAQHSREDQHRRDILASDAARQRNTEQEMVDSLTRSLQDKENEKARIALERDIAVASLRDRAPRRVVTASATGTSPADCKGATGAELSIEDATAALGEAARADKQRAALSACYAQYDAMRELVNRPAPAAEQ